MTSKDGFLGVNFKGFKTCQIKQNSITGGLAVEKFKDMSLVVLEFLVVYVCGPGGMRSWE